MFSFWPPLVPSNVARDQYIKEERPDTSMQRQTAIQEGLDQKFVSPYSIPALLTLIIGTPCCTTELNTLTLLRWSIWLLLSATNCCKYESFV